MRNYKIKHSKRNIKKVFKHVFGEVYFMGAVHGMKTCHFRKPNVGMRRYMLMNLKRKSLLEVLDEVQAIGAPIRAKFFIQE